MGEIIMITSGKGGTGKTTMTAYLGEALASCGKKVLLMDLNCGLNHLDQMLRLDDKVVYHLNDVLAGNCRILQALLHDRFYENLYFLPAPGQPDDIQASPEKFAKLMNIFKKQFDYVLIDSMNYGSAEFRQAYMTADRALVITTPDRLAVRSAVHMVGALDPEFRSGSALLINRLRMDLLKAGKIMDPEMIVGQIGLPLLGITPEDEDLYLAPDLEANVIEINSMACRSFKNIARRILGENVPIILKGRK